MVDWLLPPPPPLLLAGVELLPLLGYNTPRLPGPTVTCRFLITCSFLARSRLYMGPNLLRPPRILSCRTAVIESNLLRKKALKLGHQPTTNPLLLQKKEAREKKQQPLKKHMLDLHCKESTAKGVKLNYDLEFNDGQIGGVLKQAFEAGRFFLSSLNRRSSGDAKPKTRGGLKSRGG